MTVGEFIPFDYHNSSFWVMLFVGDSPILVVFYMMFHNLTGA